MKELYSYRGYRWLLAIALLSLALLSGCSRGPTEDTLSLEDEAALIERVSQRWYAMESKDFDAVYEYMTPNYRSIFSKRMFLNNFGYDVNWELTEVEVVNYDARVAVASVVVRVMSEPAKPTSEASKMIGALPAVVREKWILIDGEWWNSAKI